MNTSTPDIFIAGGGIAGLIAALGFAGDGFEVCLVDPGPMPKDERADDLRSTAYLQPARDLLHSIGIWPLVADRATPLEILRVIDCVGNPPETKTERSFEAADLGAPAFGWNLPNAHTRYVLAKAALDHQGIDLRFGTGFKSLLARDTEAMITLTDGTRLRSKLAIAADGRTSPLREAAGIDVDVTRYGQKALAFHVTHDQPHNAVSTELYHSGGAFVLVPLPDVNGKPASAVVWMNDGPEAVRLSKLDDAAFAAAATARSADVLGPLTLISPRQIWPVVTQTARSLTARRVAIIAEAAHVLPPIGAQGLNTSLTDIRHLLEVARAAPEDLGSTHFLDRFAALRARDIATRARVIDLYNRICRSGDPSMQSLRSLGLRLSHDIAPLRRGLMRAGLGG